MVAYYQELVLLGAEAALGNFQLFAKNAHQQMQSKIDSLMASASSVVSESSCTLLTPPEVVQIGCCSGCCNDLLCTPCSTGVNDFCLYTRMGCKSPYSMVGTNGCVDLGTKFCGKSPNCTVCTQSRSCNKVACYDDMNNNNQMSFCGNLWSAVWQEEKKKATSALKAQYIATLANVSRFLDILQNYSQEPLSAEVFGAYSRVGYRKPSCDASTASHAVIAQCQQGETQLQSHPGLPHSNFHP